LNDLGGEVFEQAILILNTIITLWNGQLVLGAILIDDFLIVDLQESGSPAVQFVAECEEQGFH